jgi:predicted flap endonuclease-1-like 5' DNA nuclease
MSLVAALASIVAALVVGFVIGRSRRDGDAAPAPSPSSPAPLPSPQPARPAPRLPTEAARAALEAALGEEARLVRSYEAEAAALRRAIVARDAALGQLSELAADRRRLHRDLAQARGETARYRQLVVDLETNAAPPLLDVPGAPDDLKLIVGVGPVLERMLHQLGIGTYRQIARWTERDIDEFEAKLPEFPGRIRRDGWVTQARALHQSKYGETLPARERG